MNNEIIISNVNPQDIKIGEGGAAGITDVLVNGSSVVENNIAYVVVPTKLSELQNNMHFITQETDPTVPYVVKQINQSDINRWNSKQDQLLSGVNIKTINNNSILGEGNINVDNTYTAGTGINITSENVINNTITSYNDLDDLPTIPTKISDLENDSDFVESSELSNVAFSGSYLDLSNTPDLSLYATLDTNELLNYYTKDFFFNILPKVSGSGTSITLNDTVDNGQMYITLGASELTQDGTPTPSSPQDIHTISGSNKVVVSDGNGNSQEADIDLGDIKYCKIGNYEDKFIRNSGKNLFDNTLFGTFTSTIKYISLQLKSNTNYTLSSNIPTGGGDGSNVFLITSTGDASTSTNGVKPNSPRTITTLNDGIIRIGYRDNDSSLTDEATKYWYMLNEGSTALPYEPYGSNEWYIKKNIGKVVLDGSETISYSGSATTPSDRTTFRFTLPYVSLTTDYISNRFIQGSSTSNRYVPVANSDRPYISFDDTILGITSGDTNAQKESKCTAWLTSNNVTIEYPITATYTQITGTLAEQLEYVYQKMLSYKGQTNISQVNNDLPFVISAVALKDMSNL